MTIHFFKDGNLNYSYEESWQRFCPTAVFKKWDASNLPVDEYPILKKYIDKCKWSILSDFTRRYSIFKEGGIYLDYDVELIAPIDDLFDKNFVCIEGKPIAANTAVCGGLPGNYYSREMLKEVISVITKGKKYPDCNTIETTLGVGVTTRLVERMKGVKLDEFDLKNVREYIDFPPRGTFYTLSKDFFFPYNWNEKYSKDLLTKNTRGIHWWKKDW